MKLKIIFIITILSILLFVGIIGNIPESIATSAIVQKASSFGTQAAVTLPYPITKGNYLIAFQNGLSSTSCAFISDSLANTWSNSGLQSNGCYVDTSQTPYVGVNVWYAKITNAGTDTISSNGAYAITVWEVAGIQNTNSFAWYANAQSNCSPCSINTFNSSGIVFAGYTLRCNTGVTSFNPETGYTLDLSVTASNNYCGIETQHNEMLGLTNASVYGNGGTLISGAGGALTLFSTIGAVLTITTTITQTAIVAPNPSNLLYYWFGLLVLCIPPAILVGASKHFRPDGEIETPLMIGLLIGAILALLINVIVSGIAFAIIAIFGIWLWKKK